MFFPAFGILAYVSAMDTYKSILMNERSSDTMLQLVIWPMKIGVTLGLLLLLYQGVLKVRECVSNLR